MPRVSYIKVVYQVGVIKKMRKFKAIDIWMLGCDTFVFVAFLEFTMAQVLIFMVYPDEFLMYPFQYLMRKSLVNQNHPEKTKTCFGTPTTSGKL